MSRRVIHVHPNSHTYVKVHRNPRYTRQPQQQSKDNSATWILLGVGVIALIVFWKWIVYAFIALVVISFGSQAKRLVRIK